MLSTSFGKAGYNMSGKMSFEKYLSHFNAKRGMALNEYIWWLNELVKLLENNNEKKSIPLLI